MSAAVASIRNLAGAGFQFGSTAKANAGGASDGKRTGGRDPISCSPKHSSAISLLVQQLSAEETELEGDKLGSETVADV